MGLTPGYTPAQQAMADAFRSTFGGGNAPAVFQAPTVIPTPACAFSSDAATADSEACQRLVRAANDQNIANNTAANYDVFLQNCLNTVPQPPDCYQRTFGLTLPGTTGGTAVDIPNAAALLGDPAAKALAAEGAHTNAPAPPAPPVTHAATGGPDPLAGKTTPSNGTTGGSSSGSSLDKTGIVVTSPVSPALYWIGGLAAVAVLIAAVK